jgi:hypothetical protein
MKAGMAENDDIRNSASAVSKFGNVQIGVNMRLADEKDLTGIELRYAWSGKGGFGYVQEARIIGPISDPPLNVAEMIAFCDSLGELA